MVRDAEYAQRHLQFLRKLQATRPTPCSPAALSASLREIDAGSKYCRRQIARQVQRKREARERTHGVLSNADDAISCSVLGVIERGEVGSRPVVPDGEVVLRPAVLDVCVC